MITLMIPDPSGAKDIKIRQEPYTFLMAMARDVNTDTFVISEHPQYGNNYVFNCLLTLVYFELGSARLSPLASKKLLADIQRCKDMQLTPLRIIGHTCKLGPEKFNQTLSLQRARTVARFLRNNGLKIRTVQGKGSVQPISNDPWEFNLNRRVEITILPENQ
jgi:OOP family OmpA-OmpF porin